MSLSSRQKALLHIAKAKLDLSDADYRSVLVHFADATSSTELDQNDFTAIMGFFEYTGFAPLKKTGPDYGNRPGMASFAQLELIRQLWSEWSGASIDDGLNVWLLRSFKVSSLRFMTKGQAAKAITALKVMKSRRAT